MPRPKIHKTAKERYAKYRERAASQRNQLRNLGLQAQGHMPPSSIIPEETPWFKVIISVNRPELGKQANLVYVMAETELSRLHYELRNFKQGTSDIKHGTYAYAASGSEISPVPGMITLTFHGVTIIQTSLIDDYKPDIGYSISHIAVNLLLSQQPRYQKPIQSEKQPEEIELSNMILSMGGGIFV